jgi:hypothetical protein
MPAYQAALAVTQYGDEPMIEINGMAHVILTVSRFEVARVFYRELLPRFGMKPVFDGDHLFYCVGGRTAIGIEQFSLFCLSACCF